MQPAGDLPGDELDFDRDGLNEYLRLDVRNDAPPSESIGRAWPCLKDHFYLCLRSKLPRTKGSADQSAASRMLYNQLPYSAAEGGLPQDVRDRFGRIGEPASAEGVPARIEGRELVRQVNERLRQDDLMLDFKNSVITHRLIEECLNYEVLLRTEPDICPEAYKNGDRQQREIPRLGEGGRLHTETPFNAAQTLLNCSIELSAHLEAISSEADLKKYCAEKHYPEQVARLDLILYRGHALGPEVKKNGQRSQWLYLPIYEHRRFFAILVGRFEFPEFAVDQTYHDLVRIEKILSQFAKFSPLIVRKVRVRRLDDEFNYYDLVKAERASAIFDQFSRLNAAFGLNHATSVSQAGGEVIQFARNEIRPEMLAAEENPVAFDCAEQGLNLRLISYPGKDALSYQASHQALSGLVKELLVFRAAQNRRALVSVISQNLSHNLGSHVLADPMLVTDHANPERLRSFHHYLQGRMDYVAQLVGADMIPQPEPLCLIADVLADFFDQSLLLNCLIRDRNFPASKMTFTILAGSSRVEYHWDEAGQIFKSSAGEGGLPTIIVGIPGGRVGRHALYTILENVIRNSAKYGSKREASSSYHMTLRLTETPCAERRYYQLEIEDNFSVFQKGNKGFEQMCDSFRGEIIDETGLPATEGQGLLEIYQAMRFLYGDAQWQPNACAWTQDERCDCNMNIKSCDDSGDPDSGRLVYSLRLPCPIQLALWQPFRGSARPPGRDALVETARGEHFTRHSHFLFAVLDSDDANEGQMAGAAQWLAENHWYLAFRVLVLTRNEERREAWRAQLERHVPRHPVRADKPFIPVRRIMVACDPALREELEALDDGSDDAPPKLANDAYRCWLEQFKPPNPCAEQPGWHLVIAFEREGEQSRMCRDWASRLEKFDDRYVTVEVTFSTQTSLRFARDSRFAATVAARSLRREPDTSRPAEFRNVLSFGNHRKMPKWLHDSQLGPAVTANEAVLRFRQSFGKNEGLRAHHYFEHPPADHESFRRYIYGIVESCLLNIAVFDERVATQLIGCPGEPASLISGRLTDLTRTGVYNVFSIHGHDHERTWVDDGFEKSNALPAEGIGLDEGKVAVRPGRMRTLKTGELDILVLHEGLIDAAEKHQQLSGGFELQYLTWLPFLCRTSGKGPKPRMLDPRLDFVESSLITQALRAGIDERGSPIYHVDKGMLAKGITNSFTRKPDLP